MIPVLESRLNPAGNGRDGSVLKVTSALHASETGGLVVIVGVAFSGTPTLPLTIGLMDPLLFQTLEMNSAEVIAVQGLEGGSPPPPPPQADNNTKMADAA